MIPQSVQKEIVCRIKERCGKCTIYLFGSYAYGNPSPGSDIDLAVIIKQVKSKIAKAAELWDSLRDVPLPKDIVVASQEEFDFYKNEAGSIFRTIAQKGIILDDE